MEVKKIGVVGCGLMGRGIVEVSAKAGYDVTVSEINQELLDKGMNAIKSSLAKAVEKGRSTEDEKNAILKRIKGTTNTQDFKDRDLVVEAAIENIELKKKIFKELDGICPPETILASNTSCLSVIDIASVTKRQPKVMGVHFFNPVPVMKLVELVRTITTVVTGHSKGSVSRQNERHALAPSMLAASYNSASIFFSPATNKNMASPKFFQT